MIDWKKLTTPIPSAINIRAAYGNDINGNKTPKPVFMELKKKLIFNDFAICYFILTVISNP